MTQHRELSMGNVGSIGRTEGIEAGEFSRHVRETGVKAERRELGLGVKEILDERAFGESKKLKEWLMEKVEKLIFWLGILSA